MDLAVTHVRRCVTTPHTVMSALIYSSFDLPEDLFEPGEIRPQRPKKKVVKRTEAAGQKRGIDELDVSLRMRVRWT